MWRPNLLKYSIFCIPKWDLQGILVFLHGWHLLHKLYSNATKMQPNDSILVCFRLILNLKVYTTVSIIYVVILCVCKVLYMYELSLFMYITSMQYQIM